MSETAYQWGLRHGSCKEALEMRRAHATQSAWWRACPRGDWMLEDLRADGLPVPMGAIEVIVERAVRTHALGCGIHEVESWARDWLAGAPEARTTSAARAAADAARSAARSAWSAADAAADTAEWMASDADGWSAWAANEAALAASDAARALWAVSVEARTAHARAAELERQADVIRAAIPEWPGGDHE